MHSNDPDNVDDIRCGYGCRGGGRGRWTDAVITCSVCDKNANQLSSPVTSNGIMLGLTQKCPQPSAWHIMHITHTHTYIALVCV